MNELKRFVEYWFLVPLAMFACCVLCVIMFMLGWETLSAVFGFCAAAAFFLQAVFLILAVVTRRWKVLAMVIVGIAGTLIAAVLTMVMFAAGQYRPPHQPIDDVDSVIVEYDTAGTADHALWDEE